MKIRKWTAMALVGMPVAAWASPQVGVLTQVDGEVNLFSHPSKTLPKEDAKAPRALYEGEYYLVQKARIGDRVEEGNILRTLPGAKTRVVYDNGDQFTVGSGTAFRIHWQQDTRQASTQMNLMYGKLRGVVEKGGPHSHLRIQTRTATMGVRGTDFFIADDGKDGSTEVSVLRGAVEVKPEAKKAKAVEVKSGSSVEVAPPTPQDAVATAGKPLVEPKVELRQTTKEDLAAIQKSSQITAEPAQAKALPKELAAKVEKLEKKAVETTMKDIKKYDPKLFAQIEKSGKPQNVDAVNANTVAVLEKSAPEAAAKRKPYKSELDDLEGGAYDRYFKNVQ